MNNRINLTDMGQELVTKTLALARAAHESGNIDKFKSGRHRFVRLHQLGQLIETFVRHFHDTDVRVNGAEGIVCGFCSRLGDCIK
ncbi:hypothetical protein D3C87_1990460 [compost metagenome]